MERGGGETFDLEMARHLAGMGCQISFLSGAPLFSGPRISNLQSPISSFHLRSPYFGWFPWDKVKGGWRLRVADFRMFERRAASWVKKHEKDYDVIQACELPFFVAGAKRRGVRVPIVMRLTAPNFYDPLGGLALADAVIASGETVRRVREGPRPDCHDIPNAVDTEQFKPQVSTFRRDHGIGGNEFVVLYVARFQDFKNHALLVDAFGSLLRQIPRAWLVLVGSGPLKRRVKAQARALGIAGRILFLGGRPFGELPGIYAAADVMSVSSDFESFCFAALEAMAVGLPIVTTDCGWVPRLIGLEGGRVVPCRDAGAMAVALAELAGSPERRGAMGCRNRRQAVQEHGWGVSADKALRVYRRLAC